MRYFFHIKDGRVFISLETILTLGAQDAGRI